MKATNRRAIVAALAVVIFSLPLMAQTGDDAELDTEVRAIWVTRWDYTSADDVRAIIDNCVDLNFNVILFQVRGNGTVFYPSEIEPWAWELTSEGPETTGQDPGWDPLALAVELAHERGVELHAYVNVFPAWRTQQYAPRDVGQLWWDHPDWFMCDASGQRMLARDHLVDPERRDWYTFISPGVPAVQDYLADLFEELVANYDVDGLHYDYIRYPAEIREVDEDFADRAELMGNWSYDAVSLARFANDTGILAPDASPEAWTEWRAAQITETVRKVSERVRALNPDIIISAAVMADPIDARARKYQDYLTWIDQGTLDLAVTMNYTSSNEVFTNRCNILLERRPDRGYITPGMTLGRGADLATEQIDIVRSLTADGFGCFAYSHLFDRDNGHVANEHVEALRSGPLASPAVLPW